MGFVGHSCTITVRSGGTLQDAGAASSRAAACSLLNSLIGNEIKIFEAWH
jgi:hypothetical protein